MADRNKIAEYIKYFNSLNFKDFYGDFSIDEKYYMNSISYSTGTNAGDGKAKITLLEMNGITDVQINNGDVPVNFSYDRYDYDFTVNNDVKQINYLCR